MKVGVLIPDRNDRPKLLANCLRMLEAQTLKPEIIKVINFHATDQECDITKRYRIGYDELRGKGLDMIALIENDDWYHPTYLETMMKAWDDNGRPDLVGQTFTIYYHIKYFEHFKMHHATRSSAMNTLIRPDLKINWCVDNDPYTDLQLWLHCGLQGVVFEPKKYITLGIKHGEGKCGGSSHVDRLNRYVNKDHDKSFLKSIMDEESFNFYSSYFRNNFSNPKDNVMNNYSNFLNDN